jgi:hypothetical protein
MRQRLAIEFVISFEWGGHNYLQVLDNEPVRAKVMRTGP